MRLKPVTLLIGAFALVFSISALAKVSTTHIRFINYTGKPVQVLNVFTNHAEANVVKGQTLWDKVTNLTVGNFNKMGSEASFTIGTSDNWDNYCQFHSKYQATLKDIIRIDQNQGDVVCTWSRDGYSDDRVTVYFGTQ